MTGARSALKSTQAYTPLFGDAIATAWESKCVPRCNNFHIYMTSPQLFIWCVCHLPGAYPAVCLIPKEHGTGDNVPCSGCAMHPLPDMFERIGEPYDEELEPFYNSVCMCMCVFKGPCMCFALYLYCEVWILIAIWQEAEIRALFEQPIDLWDDCMLHDVVEYLRYSPQLSLPACWLLGSVLLPSCACMIPLLKPEVQHSSKASWLVKNCYDVNFQLAGCWYG